MSTKAAHWRLREDGKVACHLCPTACVLAGGRDGPCGTRGHRDGRMVAFNYGRLSACGMDPIEKKPLYHFLPGAPILSVAAAGCNLHCAFCQNWQLSQGRATSVAELSPADVVDLARREGSVGVAYTYSEPLVWFEFVRDTARLVREAGLVNVIVSNGYLNPDPLAELLPLIDAANIDLKSMDEDFYRDVCKGHLQPVLATIEALYRADVHVEITNLVIPGHNDAPGQIERLRDRVADLSPDIPLHLSAYHPAWQFDAPPTSAEILERAARTCAERLHHVYIGNLGPTRWSDTRCPDCGELVIERRRGRARCDLATPHCPGCGRRLPLVLAREERTTS